MVVVKGPRMSPADNELPTFRHWRGLVVAEHPTSATEDDYDDRDDEHTGENEAPEEFEINDEDPDESEEPDDDDPDTDDSPP